MSKDLYPCHLECGLGPRQTSGADKLLRVGPDRHRLNYVCALALCLEFGLLNSAKPCGDEKLFIKLKNNLFLLF